MIVARLTACAVATAGVALLTVACATTPRATPQTALETAQPSYRIEVHELTPTRRPVPDPEPAATVGSIEYAKRMLRDAQARLSGCRALAEHDGASDDMCVDAVANVQVWQDAVDGKGYPAAWADSGVMTGCADGTVIAGSAACPDDTTAP